MSDGDTQIPNREFACIEYPGFVQNDSAALATLKGTSAVEKSIQSAQPLRLFLRPDNPYSAPIYGEVQSCNRLVLKVTRKKNVQETETNFKAEVVGIIKKVIKFEDLADYQQFPTPEESVHLGRKSLIPEMGKEFEPFASAVDDPVYMPLPIISSNPRPLKYNFHSNAAFKKIVQSGKAREEIEKAILEMKRRALRSLITLTFNSPDPAPTKAQEDLPPVNETEDAYICIKKIMDERPIVSRLYLEAHIPEEYHNKIKRIMPYLAYSFATGPWRTFYIRIGYDPRTEPDSRIYQVYDFRIPGAFGYLIKRFRHDEIRNGASSRHSDAYDRSSPVIHNNADRIDMIRFTSIPQQRQIFLQLCDLDGDSLNRIIHGSHTLVTPPSEKYGWYPASVYSLIKKALQERFYQMLKQAGIDPGAILRDKKSSRAPMRRRKRLHRNPLQDGRQIDGSKGLSQVQQQSGPSIQEQSDWNSASNLDILAAGASFASVENGDASTSARPDQALTGEDDLSFSDVSSSASDGEENQQKTQYGDSDSGEEADTYENPAITLSSIPSQGSVVSEAVGRLSGLATEVVDIDKLDSKLLKDDDRVKLPEGYEEAIFSKAVRLVGVDGSKTATTSILEERRVRSEINFLSSLSQSFKSASTADRKKDLFQVYDGDEEEDQDIESAHSLE